MSEIENKLKSLNIKLPVPKAPVGAYVATKITGKLLFISGQISIDTFIDQPKVINGASDIIAKIFDKKGEHTRAAVSVNSLPLGVAVEVDGIFELN